MQSYQIKIYSAIKKLLLENGESELDGLLNLLGSDFMLQNNPLVRRAEIMRLAGLQAYQLNITELELDNQIKVYLQKRVLNKKSKGDSTCTRV